MKLWIFALLCLQITKLEAVIIHKRVPLVITTWGFLNATLEAWNVLEDDGGALDAVEEGCSFCERNQCDKTVGYGGSPDENGETTLDALIMDGSNLNVGAVGSLRRIKSAMAVARFVLDFTEHSMLVGDLATQFAVKMGFKEESLTTEDSKNVWLGWREERDCQPNFWKDVSPDPRRNCGPYRPVPLGTLDGADGRSNPDIDRYNHDTIGMVVIDARGNVAAGTSTNGAKFKIPGRVGDSPIPGAGAYADNAVGGAAATGDGDVMMRFLPSFIAVEEMRRGATPKRACQEAIYRITRHYPNFMGAVVAVNTVGQFGAACHGIRTFPFVIVNQEIRRPLKKIICQQTALAGAIKEASKRPATSELTKQNEVPLMDGVPTTPPQPKNKTILENIRDLLTQEDVDRFLGNGNRL